MEANRVGFPGTNTQHVSEDISQRGKRRLNERRQSYSTTASFDEFTGSSCGISRASLLKWENCDTLTKQIGFISGSLIKNVGYGCAFTLKGACLIIIPIGNVLDWSRSKLCKLAFRIVVNSKCIFVNEFTRSLSSRIHTTFLLPTAFNITQFSRWIFNQASRRGIQLRHGIEFYGAQIFTNLAPVAKLVEQYTLIMLRKMSPLGKSLACSTFFYMKQGLQSMAPAARIAASCANSIINNIQAAANRLEDHLNSCGDKISKLVSPVMNCVDSILASPIICRIGSLSNFVFQKVLWSHVLRPVGTFGREMIHGTISGAFGNNQAVGQNAPSNSGSSSEND